jgi:hypothetical protein
MANPMINKITVNILTRVPFFHLRQNGYETVNAVTAVLNGRQLARQGDAFIGFQSPPGRF